MNSRINLLKFFKGIYLKHVHFFHIMFLVLSVVIIYWPAYHFKFLIGWDDQWFVTNRFTQGGFTFGNLYEIIISFYYGQYAPLNQAYYSLLYSLFGYDPAYYHIAGIIIHLANVILVYFFINIIARKLINVPEIRFKQISFLTSLLFAILPFNIEPVAWVGASKVLLYTLFYLIALMCYCKYLDTKKSVLFYLTLFFFVLSFGGKEQAVLFPVCLVLLDYMYNRNFRKRTLWFEKVPFFILALLFGLITIQSSQAFYGEERYFYSFFQRIPLAAYTLTEYFTKTLIPVNISYLYPYPFLVSELAPWWLWIYVVAIPVIVYCFFKQIRIKWLLFGLLFFFIHIVLVINLVPLARNSVVADRYAYLSTIGLCFIISCIFVRNMYKVKFKKVLLISGVLYVGILITYSCNHIRVWQNAYTLKEKLKKTIENRKDFNELKKFK